MAAILSGCAMVGNQCSKGCHCRPSGPTKAPKQLASARVKSKADNRHKDVGIKPASYCSQLAGSKSIFMLLEVRNCNKRFGKAPWSPRDWHDKV